MNLLFAISFVRWGGVNTWMLELAEALQALGHSVRILAPRGHLMLKKAVAAGLPTSDAPFGPDFWWAIPWRARLRSWKIDGVLTNTSKENRTVGAAARLLRRPVVQWVGLAKDLRRNTPTTRLERRWIVDRLVAECRTMREEILERFPHIDPAKLVWIRPGKPRRAPRASRDQLQAELGLDASRLNAVICSQLTRGKGHAELVEAVRLLRDEEAFKSRGFHLSIFHTGAEAADLERGIAACHLSDLIRLRGFDERVTDWLPAFDIGLLPSHWEGLANNLREYMMAGLCPIVSNLSGSTEVVLEGRNGWVHRVGDAADIARQIRAALEAPGLVERHRRQAWEDAQTFFGMEQSVRQIEELFRTLRNAQPA